MLKVVSKNKNTWGINSENSVVWFDSKNWIMMGIFAIDIDVSSDGSVWCLSPAKEIFNWRFFLKWLY